MTDTAQPEAATEELPFAGFAELIQKPLEESDPLSFKRIRRMFLDIPGRQVAPFRLLILRLSGKTMREEEAREAWRSILDHKNDLQAKLNRAIGIQATTVDYFDLLANPRSTQKLPVQNSSELVAAQKGQVGEEWIERAYTPGYHLERLREEMMRAKRYKHSLSAIMLDIDEFHKVNEQHSFREGDRILTAIVKIVRKAIRTVDILARYSGDRFVVVLPNTNKREALELAERLRKNVQSRAQRLAGLETEVTITAAVEQWSNEVASIEFVRKLEGILEHGKKTKRNEVHSL